MQKEIIIKLRMNWDGDFNPVEVASAVYEETKERIEEDDVVAVVLNEAGEMADVDVFVEVVRRTDLEED